MPPPEPPVALPEPVAPLPERPVAPEPLLGVVVGVVAGVVARWASRSSSAVDASARWCWAVATSFCAVSTLPSAVWHAVRPASCADAPEPAAEAPAGPVDAGAAPLDPAPAAAHTVVALSSADFAAASAVSTLCWAASTACWAAASCGSAGVAAVRTILGPVLVVAELRVADDPEPADPEPPAPPAPAPPTLWPESAFESVSFACASAAAFVWSVSTRDCGSSDASACPTATWSPTATFTVETVPLIGNATVACETGSMVATP